MAMAEEQDGEFAQVTPNVAAAIMRNEAEAQLDAAHKYKRSISKFLHEATGLATVTQEVAESCIYSMPRADKMITGPSVRLAEICASSYGNLQIGARVVSVEDTEVVAQGAAWDMEKNLRCMIEVRRRITNKYGKRYNDDMITMTGNAAASIALRNAIFRVVPRAFVDRIYDKAREVAVGNAKTLGTKRLQLIERFGKLGVTQDRILQRLDKKGVDDIDLDDLTLLIGLGTAIKNGESTIEEAFPVAPPAVAPPENDGKRMSIKGKSKGSKNAPAEQGEREPGEEG